LFHTGKCFSARVKLQGHICRIVILDPKGVMRQVPRLGSNREKHRELVRDPDGPFSVLIVVETQKKLQHHMPIWAILDDLYDYYEITTGVGRRRWDA
jgi:hypothetical protein